MRRQPGAGGKALWARQKGLSWDCQAVLLGAVLLGTGATGHTRLLRCWPESELPHLTGSTFQELMRSHAGQCGHDKLHYHAGAFLRQGMMKETAPKLCARRPWLLRASLAGAAGKSGTQGCLLLLITTFSFPL